MKIANREALSFLCIGFALAVLFGVSIYLMSKNPSTNAGHIYSVVTYLWTFAFCLDDVPRLIEEFSKLKDIGKRVRL